jgi:hypothetical protein
MTYLIKFTASLYKTSYKASLCIGTVFCLMFFMTATGQPASGQEIVTAPAYDPAQEAAIRQEARELYTVDNVIVDVTADNAVQAREKAFQEAQIKAFTELAGRFLSDEEMESFEAPSIEEVSRYVKDFEVTNEQLSAVRYKGNYQIRFSNRTFRDRKQQANALDAINNPAFNQSSTSPLSPSSNSAADILVIPFYETQNGTILWQENPLLEAWARAEQNNTSGRALLPVGDAQDMASINAGMNALQYDPTALNAMRLRYQAREAALVVATPEAMNDGTTAMAVSVYEAKSFGPTLAKQFSVKSYAGEAADQFYNRVIAQTAIALENNWQRPTAVREVRSIVPQTNRQLPDIQPQAVIGPVKNIMAQLSFNDVREWVGTKRRIEGTRGVETVEVKSLSPQTATVVINFRGSLDNMRQSLQQQGMGLSDVNMNGADGSMPIYKISATTTYR